MRYFILGILFIILGQAAWTAYYERTELGPRINSWNDCVGGWIPHQGFDKRTLSLTMVTWSCPKGHYIDPFDE